MSNIINGSKLMVFLEGDAIAWSTNHTATCTANLVERSTKDHGVFTSNEIGSISWELTSENLYSTASYDTLYDYMIMGTKVDVKFAVPYNWSPNGLVAAGGDTHNWEPSLKYMTGKAVISSLDVTAQNGEDATFSVTFTGSSALTKTHELTTPYVVTILYHEVYEGATYKLWNDSQYVNYYTIEGTTQYYEEPLKTCMNDNVFTAPEDIDDLTVTMYLFSPIVNDTLFRGNEVIREVTVSGSITDIGKNAFRDAHNLESFVAESQLVIVSDYAFYGCGDLNNLDLGERCVRIDDYAFYDTFELLNVTIPGSVRYIDAHAFDHSNAMQNFEITFEPTDPPALGQDALGYPADVAIYLTNSDRQTYEMGMGWSPYADSIITH